LKAQISLKKVRPNGFLPVQLLLGCGARGDNRLPDVVTSGNFR